MDVGADTWERRQKASAVLIGFLSWTRLLWGIRVERENGSEPKFGQISARGPGWEIALSPIVMSGFGGQERCWRGPLPVGELA